MGKAKKRKVQADAAEQNEISANEDQQMLVAWQDESTLKVKKGGNKNPQETRRTKKARDRESRNNSNRLEQKNGQSKGYIW